MSNYFRCGNKTDKKTAFICSSNAQQLTLPVYMDENIIIKTKLIVPSFINSDTSIINNEWNVACFALYISGNKYAIRDNPNRVVEAPANPWEIADIEFRTNTGAVLFNGVSYGGQGGNYNHKNICLFGIENAHFSCCGFSDLEILKNGVSYLKLKAMKDDNTGEGYFYDADNDVSYRSSTLTPLIYAEF